MPAIPLIKKRRRKDAILRAKGSAGTKSRARHTMQQQQQRNRPALMLKVEGLVRHVAMPIFPFTNSFIRICYCCSLVGRKVRKQKCFVVISKPIDILLLLFFID